MELNLLCDPKSCRKVALLLHLASKDAIYLKITNLEEVSNDHVFSIISPTEKDLPLWHQMKPFLGPVFEHLPGEKPNVRQVLGTADLQPLPTASIMAPIFHFLFSKGEARQLFRKLWKKIFLKEERDSERPHVCMCACASVWLQVLACPQLAGGMALACFFVSKLQNNHQNKNLSKVLMSCLISLFLCTSVLMQPQRCFTV